MTNQNIKVSVVIPVYNELDNLRRCIAELRPALKTITDAHEIIIAEDGSTDGTRELAEQMSRSSPDIVHLHSDTRLGKGGALSQAFKASHGQILVFMDADLSTDLKHLETLVRSIEEGADFATGSRTLPASDIRRPWKRAITSRVYSSLVWLLFRLPVRDTQCGFKAFRREALMSLLDDIEDRHLSWDAECLIRAYRRGYKVVEFPVTWRHSQGSKVRLLRDARDMGLKLIRLWWKMRRGKI